MNAAGRLKLPDPSALPEAMRERLTVASRPLVKGATSMFWFEGELQWGVCRSAIRAYLVARLVTGDAAQAVAEAVYGTTNLGEGGLRHVRAMVWRLGQLERGKAA
jgi:hypothetical protein